MPNRPRTQPDCPASRTRQRTGQGLVKVIVEEDLVVFERTGKEKKSSRSRGRRVVQEEEEEIIEEKEVPPEEAKITEPTQ